MNLNENELAFAENLLLLGGLPAPQVIYLIRRKELLGDERMLWEISADLGLADKGVLNAAYRASRDALDAFGPQEFSFSDGAMIGPWELSLRKAGWIGGEVWQGNQGGTQAMVRVVPPGSGHDDERQARFIERSNVGLEPPHPSILKIDQAAEDFGWLYAASVGTDGDPLASLLERGPLAERSALSFAHGLAGSLQVIHDLGVVHGGLNPLGILVRESRPHLTDFGFCSALLDGPAAGNRPGGRLGVLLFAAPALVRGDAERGLDARDDLYALGALVYLLICDPQPDDQPTGGDPWFVAPNVSPDTLELLGRLLAGQTSAYPSARALIADLGRLAQGAELQPLPPDPSARGRRAETAAPQQALGADGEELEAAPLSASAAPGDEDEDEEEEAPRAPARRASQRVGKASSGRVPVKAKSERLAKRASGRVGRTSSRSVVARPPSSGWGLFLGTLLLLGAVGGGAVMLTQPQGADKARQTLAQAFRASREQPVAYDVVIDLSLSALKQAKGDPLLSRDALQLRRNMLLTAERERRAVLAQADGQQPAGGEQPADAEQQDGGGEGEAAASPTPAQPAGGGKQARQAMLGLQQRLTNTDLESLANYDATRLKGGDTVPLVWGEIGLSLLERGHAEAASDALQRGSRPERGRALLASRMAYLPGGPYLVPGPDGPQVVQRKPVYVGRTEVSRGEYRLFLRAIAAQENPHEHCDQTEPDDKDHSPQGWGLESQGDDALPATGVDYYDAVAYASWLGGRLPDAATLAAAAQGPLGTRYPWGDQEPGPAFANCAGLLGGAPTPVGCFPGGAGEGGALDLLGNVAEWVTPPGDAMKPTSAPVWGGDCTTPAAELKPAVVEELPLATRKDLVGFRVLLDVKPAE